ncbi:hypothetical protein [Thermoactinomyces sp. DSM 45892]|uniref:hypothetical protein n=1 Tax=Thermoactinomyces sp. DSM 45892 TaxID=1882753 RepID=UPI0008970BED|nr:hypothetical protein [Thermoactinomyces sp. DSM 45892]SDZ26267.1 hypothetical protein SAMN05444416_11813 [Thermoactinomyces sp. DSM 45892]
MSLLKWALFWTITAVLLIGVLSYIGFDSGLAVWGSNLKFGAGLFFAVALVVGGVLTTDKNYKAKTKSFYREEWSFICLLVTISLFGISLVFS